MTNPKAALVAGLLLHYPNQKWTLRGKPAGIDVRALDKAWDALGLPAADRPAGHYLSWRNLVCLRCKTRKVGTDEYRYSPYLPYCPSCCHDPSYIENISWSLDSIWLPVKLSQLPLAFQLQVHKLLLDKLTEFPHYGQHDLAGSEESL